MKIISKEEINIHTLEGLNLLKEKAKQYGHYASNLLLLELIQEVEKLREELKERFELC